MDDEKIIVSRCEQCGDTDPDYIMPLDCGAFICMDCYGTAIGIDEDIDIEETPF